MQISMMRGRSDQALLSIGIPSLVPSIPWPVCAAREEPASAVGRVGYVRRNYLFMPANAALRCQSNKADRSSWARDDGVIGTDL